MEISHQDFQDQHPYPNPGHEHFSHGVLTAFGLPYNHPFFLIQCLCQQIPWEELVSEKNEKTRSKGTGSSEAEGQEKC